MSLTAEQIANLRQLQNVLRAVPDTEYNHDELFHSCGTPACAMGHAATAEIGGMYVLLGTNKKTPWIVHDHVDTLWTDDVAHYVFGTGSWTALFNVDAFDTLDVPAKPRHVIDRIDRFIEENS
ncbi:MAG: hypothetical protein KDA57_13940 [Planctomycetales bacterium]|nr:hypothetical protein [Planctomycetales bacterium]